MAREVPAKHLYVGSNPITPSNIFNRGLGWKQELQIEDLI